MIQIKSSQPHTYVDSTNAFTEWSLLNNCDKYFTLGSHSCVRLMNKYENGSFVASM